MTESELGNEYDDFIDLVGAGQWAREHVEHEAFENELGELMSQKLKVWYDGYIPNTPTKTPEQIKSYVSSCRAFSRWCHEFNINPEGVKPTILASYLHELVKNGGDAELVAEAVGFAHESTGFANPALSDICKGVLRYAAIHNNKSYTNGSSHDKEATSKELH